MELTEQLLRVQVKGVITGEIVSVEITLAQNDLDRFGATFYARDNRIMGYTSRMKGFARQGKTHLVEFCQQLVDALKTVRDDEPLYHWVIVQSAKRVHGLSTPLRLIGVIPDDYLG